MSGETKPQGLSALRRRLNSGGEIAALPSEAELLAEAIARITAPRPDERDEVCVVGK